MLVLLLCGQTILVCGADKYNENIQITKEGMVADSLNGVDAIYRKGGLDGSNATYSCAAYVKKYYNKVYGVVPYNLFKNSIPLVANDKFVKVSKPQVGDIVAEWQGSSHWSIVKEVLEDKVVVIEQNFKWSSGGNYYTRVNRTVSNDKAVFFRLESQLKEDTPASKEEKETEVVSEPKQEEKKEVAKTLTLSKSDVTLKLKEKFTLKASYLPSNTKVKITFKSENKAIAVVNQKGQVTAKKVGKTNIVVTTSTGLTKKCIVRVKKA